MKETIVILENIRSAYNVGAVFRTADGSGVRKVFLGGYTPTPVDRFGRPQSEIIKTSLGACNSVQWEHVPDVVGLVQTLQESGVSTVAIELTEKAVSLKETSIPKRVAYVFGNEVTGVSDQVLQKVDAVCYLPMLGEKESLNIATTAGIVLYRDLV